MDNAPVLRKVSYVCLAGLLILCAGALILYRERMLFADAAYIVFNIVNYKTLSIIEHRYGSFITQIFPYIAQSLHLPLKTILIWYSFSFNLFYLLVFLALTLWFRQYRLAIIMTLYYFLFVSQSYFWTNNEVHQAIALMFLCLGSIVYMGNKGRHPVWIAVVYTLLMFFTIFTHFVVLIPTFFILIYLIAEKEQWPFGKGMSILFIVILALLIAVKYFVSISGGAATYDSKHLYGVTHFSLQDIIDSFSQPAVKVFYFRCLTNYWVAIIIFVLGVSMLFKAGKKLLASWVIIACAGYIIIMGLSYVQPQDDQIRLFHIEAEWQAIGIIVAAPFVAAVLSKVRTSYAVMMISLIIGIRLVYICTELPAFTWRTHFQEDVLTKMRRKGITKLAIYNDNAIREKYISDWAMPLEFLMASSLDGDKPVRSFTFLNRDDKENYRKMTTLNGVFDVYNVAPQSNLDVRYFPIDTTCTYTIMSWEDFVK